MICDGCSEEFESLTETGENEWLCEECLDDYVKCDNCNEYFSDLNEVSDGSVCDECLNHYACCDDCGEYVPCGDIHEVEDGTVCSGCLEDYTCCDDCNKYHKDTYQVEGRDLCEDCASCYSCYRCGEIHENPEEIHGNYYCPDCACELFSTCEDCGCYESREECYVTYDGYCICQGCYEDNYFCCDGCGEIYPYDECFESDDRYYCAGCAPDICQVGSPIYSAFFEELKYKRWFGVEIETDSGDYEECPEGWGRVQDASISGMELVSPLLQGDSGLDSVREVYNNVRPDFDIRCGLHVHIDVRDLSEVQRFELIKRFIRTKDFWFDYVDDSRHNNRFCRGNLLEPIEGETFFDYCHRSGCERYRWVNVCAISKHGSIEVRLHEATDACEKVIEWIKLLVGFVSDVAEDKRLSSKYTPCLV